MSHRIPRGSLNERTSATFRPRGPNASRPDRDMPNTSEVSQKKRMPTRRGGAHVRQVGQAAQNLGRPRQPRARTAKARVRSPPFPVAAGQRGRPRPLSLAWCRGVRCQRGTNGNGGDSVRGGGQAVRNVGPRRCAGWSTWLSTRVTSSVLGPDGAGGDASASDGANPSHLGSGRGVGPGRLETP